MHEARERVREPREEIKQGRTSANSTKPCASAYLGARTTAHMALAASAGSVLEPSARKKGRRNA